MKNNFQLLVLITFSLFVFVACNKEDKEKNQNKNVPTVEITSPEDGTSYSYGDTVDIKATMSGLETLHGYSIELVTHEADTIMSFHAHAHNLMLHVDTFWVNSFRVHQTVDVLMTGIGDHSGMKTTESVVIHCIGE